MERVMSRVHLAVLALAAFLAAAPAAHGQVRPYIGFVYPAGGQQGTTFRVKLGGQGLDGVETAQVTGQGVSAKLVDYQRKFGPQEVTLLHEQLRELRDAAKETGNVQMMMSGNAMPSSGGDAMMMSSGGAAAGGILAAVNRADPKMVLMARIQRRIADYILRPACASLASIAYVEVTIAPDALPGSREFTLITRRGVSNPLVFHVGQVPEYCRKPMITADFQVLGKEELALRKRPEEEVEDRITIPCTVNGQVATGEVNRYRFEARKGQRLVLSTAARQLIPYVADAVPGWFQPVLTLYDSDGKEVAYNDDFRFKPDPVIFFDVPKDGEYVFAIADAIYRGREDFVYRITIGELPMLTSVFPLGRRVGDPLNVELGGWNLQGASLVPPPADAEPGVVSIAARRNGVVSNSMPFALDTLPECFEQEGNNDAAHAQPVQLPVIVNGRINRSDDWDVFEVVGHAGQTLVAEVNARRLESPLDSVLRVTDANGKLIAFNDDCEDLGAGTNTHDADSHVMVKLPADGKYYVYLGDTARSGGEAYAYRLRLSEPRPDFALRVVPSSTSMRSKGSTAVSVYVIRKDGFNGPIKLGLKNPPIGFSSYPVTLTGNQAVTRLAFKTDLFDTPEPVSLVIEGRGLIEDVQATAAAQKAELARRAEAAKQAAIARQKAQAASKKKLPPRKASPQPPLPIVGTEIARDAVPAEDRMQAFLWRHLVPAKELKVLVFDPAYEPPPCRVRREFPPEPVQEKPAVAAVGADGKPVKPKFTKQQVAGRLRELKLLFEEGLTTDEFDHKKVLECEAIY
jgi:hypothetical protein